MAVAAACLARGVRAETQPAQRAPAVPVAADSARSDSVYTLPPIVVSARRIEPATELLLLPGQVSYVEIEPLRASIGEVSEVLESLPGVQIRDFGSMGHYSSVSIRGATAAQVSVYLDGVPLTRGGAGVTNLADLPFAGLDHIEVYRGFAPPGLPGSSMGGAIHLVTRAAGGAAPPAGRAVAAAGSFGTRRLGASEHVPLDSDWGLLVVADFLRSDGNFEYDDDNGTPLNPADDARAVRRNNSAETDEVLLKLGRELPRGGRIDLLNHWVHRAQGVAGLASSQAKRTRQGSTHDLTSAALALPALGTRARVRAQIFHDWRRDWFADPASEIGLGYQDNRDVTQAVGAHVETALHLPALQRLGLHADLRRERFLPWRRYPHEQLGPEQVRVSLELTAAQTLLLLGGRVRLHGDVRAARTDDDFSGDLRTPYSRRPAAGGRHEYLEPRIGARVRLLPGVHAEATYGRHHRTPSFLELFGDGGAVAGSSDLVAEEGTHRDYGIDVEQAWLGLRFGVEAVHFRNRTDHLITFLTQPPAPAVARNIGSARLQGMELSWRLVPRAERPRWRLDGSYTHQHTEDLGVDLAWYAGKALPGRPQHQLSARLGFDFGPVAFGWLYEHLGRNYLDRWNRDAVDRRDLHGIDLDLRVRAVALRLAMRNLTDDQAVDVAGFPVPGRTFSLSSELRF